MKPLLDAIVQVGLKPVVLTTVQPYSTAFSVQRAPVHSTLPNKMSYLQQDNLVGCADDVLATACHETMAEMTVTAEAATILEQATRQQRKCLLWHEHRLGRLTASNFHAAVRTHPLKPSMSLMKSILCPSFAANPRSAAQRWGIEHEDDARNMYAELYSDHRHHVVQSAGLVISKEHAYLGASPDGWISDKCCGDGVLEVKCPYSIRHQSPDTAEYLYRDDDYSLVLDCKHSYYAQVQGQIHICDVHYCDFVVWTEKGIAVVRVFRDDNFWNTMLPKLTKLFQCSILPRLLTGESRSVPI